MISTSDFRKGMKVLFKGEPYVILDYHSVKPGKGGAYIPTKMRNMITGHVHEETFRSGEKLQVPNLAYKDMQYLYNEDDLYHFMDQDTFDQVALNSNQLEEVSKLLKEQTVYTVLYFNEDPIAVTPPLHMDLQVVETTPGVRGDTAQGGATKAATLETGLCIQIPLFVEQEDIVRIDTRYNTYLERVKNK